MSARSLPQSRYTSNLSFIVKVLDFIKSGGAGGTRTPYLILAKDALSLMSYSPKI